MPRHILGWRPGRSLPDHALRFQKRIESKPAAYKKANNHKIDRSHSAPLCFRVPISLMTQHLTRSASSTRSSLSNASTLHPAYTSRSKPRKRSTAFSSLPGRSCIITTAASSFSGSIQKYVLKMPAQLRLPGLRISGCDGWASI